MPSTEKQTQKAVMDYLGYKRILHWRNQSGQIPIKDGLGQMKYMMNFGMAGSPDIFALKDGTLYGLEIKDIKGRQNPNQIDFERRFNEAGGKYYVIRDLDAVVAIFGAMASVPKPPRAIPEVPSCNHRCKSIYHAPSGKTLCQSCIDALEGD